MTTMSVIAIGIVLSKPRVHDERQDVLGVPSTVLFLDMDRHPHRCHSVLDGQPQQSNSSSDAASYLFRTEHTDQRTSSKNFGVLVWHYSCGFGQTEISGRGRFTCGEPALSISVRDARRPITVRSGTSGISWIKRIASGCADISICCFVMAT